MRLVGNNSIQSLISSAHAFSEVIMRGLRGEYASLLRSTQLSFCFQGWAWVRASSNCPLPGSTSVRGPLSPSSTSEEGTSPNSLFPPPTPHIHTQWDPHSPKSLILDSWLKIPHPGWVNCHMQGRKVCHSNLNYRPVLYFCTTLFTFCTPPSNSCDPLLFHIKFSLGKNQKTDHDWYTLTPKWKCQNCNPQRHKHIKIGLSEIRTGR